MVGEVGQRLDLGLHDPATGGGQPPDEVVEVERHVHQRQPRPETGGEAPGQFDRRARLPPRQRRTGLPAGQPPAAQRHPAARDVGERGELLDTDPLVDATWIIGRGKTWSDHR